MTSQIRVDEITNRSGLGTVTIYDNGFEFTGVTTFTEDVDITGGLTIGGVLTYEDVTNIDSVGVVTARGGIQINADNKYLKIGADNDISLVHTGAESFITNATGHLTRRSNVHKWENYDGSSEYARITSAGQMGLGISSPARGGLHIHKAATAELHLTDDTTGSTSGDGFTLFSTSSSAGVWYRENAPLRFASNNTERLRITSDGDIKTIGNNGQSFKFNSNLGVGARNIQIWNSQQQPWHSFVGTNLEWNGTNYVKPSDNSNTNWGNTAGIVFEGAAAGNTPAIRFLVDTPGENGTDYSLGSSKSTAIDNKTVACIAASGNVGIGTENPDTQLQVFGSSTTGNLKIGGGNGAGSHRVYISCSETNSYIDSYGNNAYGKLRINAAPLILNDAGGGNIGIGTDNPGAFVQIHKDAAGNLPLLQTKSHATATGSFTNNYSVEFRHASSTVTHGMLVVNNEINDARRTLDIADGNGIFATFTNGKVGIDVTNPRAKLDVRGTALISDDIGSTLPSTFPAPDVQLMVYTSTNGQPITNTNCARILLATDAKQTGPQGYNGAIDFGNSDATASGANNQYNYRVASIMSQAINDTQSTTADGNLEFWTKTSSGSLSQKMGISAEGYVTKPNHPLFDAVRNSGHMSANAYINFNTVKANNGGHYNSSNGRFTAPVAGYYFFSWTAIKNGTNTVTRLYIHKNGSAAYGNRHLRLDSGQDYGDNGTMTAVIQLAENDYVQIYLGAGAIYGVTEEYSIFNGYLLG